MRYFFFDIDGTLLLSGGAGRIAMTQVMQEMFGLTELHRVKVHGRTDRGIVEELFTKHGLPCDEEVRQQFSNRYHELLPDSMHECEGVLMPGAVELLERLAETPQVKLGILTGNSESAAWSKLRHFEIDQFFEFGGFGGNHAARNDVARLTLKNCRATYKDHQIEPDQAWVVGDTVNDITCARAIGAKVIAVATGGSDYEELSVHEPDLLLRDLSDPEFILTATENPESFGKNNFFE